MSGAWALISLALPPLVTAVAWVVLSSRQPHPFLVIGLNAVMPGAGLAVARRPVPEVASGVVFSIICLIAVAGFEDIAYWVPIMVIGGVWGFLHTPLNPLTRPPPPREIEVVPPGPIPRPAPSKAARRSPAGARPQPQAPTTTEADQGPGYSVTMCCTECGADIEVPVLQHMVHCAYCGSDQLVVGHEETLYVALPEQVQGQDQLRDAILDHYRYQHYLKLYRRHVAPLQAQADAGATSGIIAASPEATAAAAAAEAAVAKKADAYRSRLAGELELGDTVHFLAPYRHGMGTLYQAAFGRRREDQEKELRFALAGLEASVLATDSAHLPDMGKLSYLRALVPAVHYADSLETLPLDRDESALDAAFGDLDRKQLVREISVIRLGSAFCIEASAVVWRPWWIVEARARGIEDTLLVDSAAGSVAGLAPHLNTEILEALPDVARSQGSGLSFLSMQCPTCGYDFRFNPSEVLHFCRNCHRVCAVHRGQKRDIDYDHGPLPLADEADLLPFWRFALRLRTGDGQLVTDVRHLRDGIDGTLDQIGDDATVGQDEVLVPAIRCINTRLMTQAFNSLCLFLLDRPVTITEGRYPLDVKPDPFPVCLAEEEARRLAPLYLVNAFARRDIARVNLRQVDSWLFAARLESRGRLTYLAVPRTVTHPFRDYVGRFKARAIEHAERS